MPEKPNILIAVPAYGGSIKRLCTERLIDICLTLQGRAISFNYSTMDGQDIAQVRNAYASIVLDSPATTHLLFIDNDMVPSSQGVLRMIDADKPVTGWVAPVRPGTGRSAGLKFNFRQHGPITDFDQNAGVCKLDAVGAGVMLIHRSVFEALRDTNKVRVQTRHNFDYRGPIYGFFDRLITDGGLIGEDLSFCRRWRELCGGSVYGMVDQTIGHIGDVVHEAKAIEHIVRPT